MVLAFISRLVHDARIFQFYLGKEKSITFLNENILFESIACNFWCVGMICIIRY